MGLVYRSSYESRIVLVGVSSTDAREEGEGVDEDKGRGLNPIIGDATEADVLHGDGAGEGFLLEGEAMTMSATSLDWLEPTWTRREPEAKAEAEPSSFGLVAQRQRALRQCLGAPSPGGGPLLSSPGLGLGSGSGPGRESMGSAPEGLSKEEAAKRKTRRTKIDGLLNFTVSSFPCCRPP